LTLATEESKEEF